MSNEITVLISSFVLILVVTNILLINKNVRNDAVMRRLLECWAERDKLLEEIEKLRREINELRNKLSNAEAEIETLYKLLLRSSQTEQAKRGDPNHHRQLPAETEETRLLLEERQQLMLNILLLRKRIAKDGERIEYINQIADAEKRIKEIEMILDQKNETRLS